MKKNYEAPEIIQLSFALEEQLMSSILDPNEGGDTVEIAPPINLF